MSATYKDIGVSNEGHVGIVEIQRPPHNFFDNSLINQIADAFEAFDRDNNIRAYVLCARASRSAPAPISPTGRRPARPKAASISTRRRPACSAPRSPASAPSRARRSAAASASP
jgi:hypothetical protein